MYGFGRDKVNSSCIYKSLTTTLRLPLHVAIFSSAATYVSHAAKLPHVKGAHMYTQKYK